MFLLLSKKTGNAVCLLSVRRLVYTNSIYLPLGFHPPSFESPTQIIYFQHRETKRHLASLAMTPVPLKTHSTRLLLGQMAPPAGIVGDKAIYKRWLHAHRYLENLVHELMIPVEAPSTEIIHLAYLIKSQVWGC